MNLYGTLLVIVNNFFKSFRIILKFRRNQRKLTILVWNDIPILRIFLVDFSTCEEKTLCLPLFIPTMNKNNKHSIKLSAFCQMQTKILTAEEWPELNLFFSSGPNDLKTPRFLNQLCKYFIFSRKPPRCGKFFQILSGFISQERGFEGVKMRKTSRCLSGSSNETFS